MTEFEDVSDCHSWNFIVCQCGEITNKGKLRATLIYGREHPLGVKKCTNSRTEK